MSDSPEVKELLKKWYSLSKKDRREHGFSFRRFVSAQTHGALEYHIGDDGSKSVKPVCHETENVFDFSHSDDTEWVPGPLPRAMRLSALDQRYVPNKTPTGTTRNGVRWYLMNKETA